MILKWKRVTVAVLIAIVISITWLMPSGLVSGETPKKQLQNLEFINVDLRQIFRSLAALGKFNVILDQTVQGNVSIAFKAGVTAKEAIDIIATNYGYHYQWLIGSDQVFVGNIKAYSDGFGNNTSVDIDVKFSDAEAVASSLETIIPKERIKPDSNGRLVTIFGNPLEIQNVREIVSRIDRPTSSVNVELKLTEVSDDFWNDTGLNLSVVRSHIGVYSLAAAQSKALQEGTRNVIHYLAQHSINLFDNQDGKLVLADRIPKTVENGSGKTGESTLQREYIPVGTTVKITSWVGEGNRITLQVKELTEILTNQPKDNVPFQPVTSSREVTSVFTVTGGQTFILTGIIGRDEYYRLKRVPGTYPLLQELFSSENGFDATRKKSARVIMLITPHFIDNPNGQTQNTEVTTIQNPLKSTFDQGNDSTSNSPNDEQKTEIQLNISPTTTPKQDQMNAAVNLVTLIQYTVKTNDTISGIAAKFRIERLSIVKVNQLENKKEIPGILLIPIPNDHIYIVKMKETIWRIAKRYGITVDLLKDLNNITDITKVKAGQKIVLPVSTQQVKNPKF